MSEPANRGHETRDASVRAVVWSGVGLALALVLIGALLVPLYHLFEHLNPSPAPPSRIAFHPTFSAPPPQLQVFPAADLTQYLAAQRAQLDTYGWVDREAGVIHIPITRAMELVAQRGFPTRCPGTQDASDITAVEMQKRKAAASQP